MRIVVEKGQSSDKTGSFVAEVRSTPVLKLQR